jgi:ATP-dependent protease ClpP protease subunit
MSYHKTTTLEEVHSYLVNQKTRTIYVNSESEDSEGGEVGVGFHMAQRFIKNLDYLNSLNTNEITVKMQNCGGCWNHGMAMYDAMYNSPAPVTIMMYAHSRSMSSIIPQAATKRIIMPNCDFMVHYGSYGDYGDLREVQSAMDHYKRTNKTMIDIYAKRCVEGPFAKEKNMTEIKMYNYIKKQIDEKTAWWLTAKEAVYYGFMDEVYDQAE